MTNLELIKKLREMTGAGILDSKKALEASNNNMDDAVEWLRKNGISKAIKKSDRIASEGVIVVKQNDSKIAMMEVNSETDFVSSNQKFLTEIEKIMDTVIKSDVKTEIELLDLKIGNDTINDLITNLISTIGEKISIRRYASFDIKSVKAAFYKHSNNKIATIVLSSDLKEDETLLKDVAMHITAMNPKFAYVSDIDEEFISKERSIIEEQYKEQYKNKPENILKNIIDGAVKKQLAEISLEEQQFVKDNSKKIKDLFPKSKIKFLRYEVGEGIEKQAVDFAKEVMEQVNNKKN